MKEITILAVGDNMRFDTRINYMMSDKNNFFVLSRYHRQLLKGYTYDLQIEFEGSYVKSGYNFFCTYYTPNFYA